MPKCENQKLKLLLLKDYLEQNTDEQNPASMAELLAFLAENGISAERKSIYADLQALEDYGMDIIRTGGKNAGYYLGSREFELPELSLLVDAVQSSKFLSEKKSMELIKKLGTLASRHQARSLRRQVTVAGRVKTMNESIYYNVDRIHDAISRNSQISFRYFEWGVDREKHFRGDVRTASPYALCWDSENYYLVAHTEAHGITHFRVDKMTAISETGAPRTVTEETKKIDLADYAKQVFYMFSGEKVTVRLRFHNSLAGVVIDRFGRDVMMIPDGEAHFCLTTDVMLSPMFLSWLTSFGDRVKILSPDNVIEAYKKLCLASLAQYE